MNVKVHSTFSFPGGWITIVLGLTTVLEKETKNISSSFSCEHSFDSIHPNSEIHFCHNHWYPFFFHVSYVGILSGYAISLVAWSWYTECADCPKVIISQDLSIKMTTKKSNWPIRMKKKSEIVAEVSYTTNWCSQDIRLKQSRILHSVLLIMESVIILRHFFRFWVQPHLIFNNLFAGPFWNVCDSDCLRPVRSNLQRWDFSEILKMQ